MMASAVWRAALSLDDLAVGFALGTLRVPVAFAVILCGAASIVMSRPNATGMAGTAATRGCFYVNGGAMRADAR